jgi:uncharacterized membrane protein YjdF
MSRGTTTRNSRRVINTLTVAIQVSLTIGLVLFTVRQDWENVALTLGVIVLIAVPTFVLRKKRVYVPPEFQLVAAAFVWLSLYLGSGHDFYYRFPWWDTALHLGSGLLFGFIGWIVLFLLLETERLPRNIHPSLVFVFGVTFAITLGVAWEIIEWVLDLAFPVLNMMSHETGVDDTMHDLILDAVGAVAVGMMGYAYSRTGRFSFLVDELRKFTHRNPRIFRRYRARRVPTVPPEPN